MFQIHALTNHKSFKRKVRFSLETDLLRKSTNPSSKNKREPLTRHGN